MIERKRQILIVWKLFFHTEFFVAYRLLGSILQKRVQFYPKLLNLDFFDFISRFGINLWKNLE
jgi:hypothetical protein